MLISLLSAFVQPVLSRVAGEVVAWPARDRTKSAKIRYIAPLCIIMRNLTCTQAGGTTLCRNNFFRMWKTRCLVVAKNQIRPQARTKLAMIID